MSSLTVVPYLGPFSSEGRKKKKKNRTDVHSNDSADEGPRKWASKVKNACHSCKLKKTRCSGHRPCARCSHRGLTCRYQPTSVSPPATTSRSTEWSVTTSTRTDESHSSAQDAPDPSYLHVILDTPRSNPNGHEVADASTTSPLQEDQYGHMHGGASVFAFLNYAKQKVASLPSMSIDFCDYPLTSSKLAPRVLPPKHVADELLDAYFNYGLSTSRLIHEPTFRKSYEALYSPVQGEHLQPDSLVLIYIVMAAGSHYSKHDNTWCGYSASVQFYEMAEQQLHQLPSRITLTSLQARFIIVHYLLNHSRMHEAWSQFGTVVRHAQALGLHSQSKRTMGNLIVHETRKRVFWVIYINDRILSSVFGRPCALHDDDIDQEECSFSNDEDITIESCRITPPTTVCSFAALIHYARLARILGKILREFYSPSTKNKTMWKLCHQATSFEADLRSWQAGLPDYLNCSAIPPSALSVQMHRQVSTLSLTYDYANLLLYRPFMLHSIGLSTSQTQHRDLQQWIKRCHDQSISAANMIISDCQSLQKRGLFSKVFWLCNYAHFAAIGTLYMYCHLWPGCSDSERETAEQARKQLPAGVEGDLVGQRYVQVLEELSQITSTAEPSSAAERLEDVVRDGMDGVPEPCVELDMQALDFLGPWSNLFFDPSLAADYLDNAESFPA